MRRTPNTKENSEAIREKGKMGHKLIYSSCLIAGLLCAVAFLWGYGSAVPLKGVGNLKVIQRPISEQKLTISVSGVIIDSTPGITVTGVSQRQIGDLILITVRKGFRRGGSRTGKFSAEIKIPDAVNAVAFGTSKDVVWHR